MNLMERRRALMMVQGEEQGKSDMNGWTDGVAYTDLTIIQNQYYSSGAGDIRSYNGWDRTDFVPCNGASKLGIPKTTAGNTGDYCWFFNQQHRWISSFSFSTSTPKEVTVPPDAFFFGISMPRSGLQAAINDGIIPYK